MVVNDCCIETWIRSFLNQEFCLLEGFFWFYKGWVLWLQVTLASILRALFNWVSKGDKIWIKSSTSNQNSIIKVGMYWGKVHTLQDSNR